MRDFTSAEADAIDKWHAENDAAVVAGKVRKQAEEQNAKKCEADALKKWGRPPR